MWEDAGVSEVLKGCPRLHTLRLMRCTGPFEDEIAASLPDRDYWGLCELCILWGGKELTDVGITKMIGLRHLSLQHLELVGCRYIMQLVCS